MKPTWGSETSQYPEERKSNETPLVAASERGSGQTKEIRLFGVVGPRHETDDDSGSMLESCPIQGDRPVREIRFGSRGILSTTGHVQSGGNLGGPSSKPKYSCATDSEPVP